MLIIVFVCVYVIVLRVIREKSDKEIMREIQAIMRQIASCITYLPCLDEPCESFPYPFIFTSLTEKDW